MQIVMVPLPALLPYSLLVLLLRIHTLSMESRSVPLEHLVPWLLVRTPSLPKTRTTVPLMCRSLLRNLLRLLVL